MQLKKIPSQGATGKLKQKSKKVELKTKSVSFNILDESQSEMYRHAVSKSNFSGYIKGLIMRDMLKHAGGLNN